MKKEEALIALKNLAKTAPPTNFMTQAVQFAIEYITHPEPIGVRLPKRKRFNSQAKDEEQSQRDVKIYNQALDDVASLNKGAIGQMREEEIETILTFFIHDYWREASYEKKEGIFHKTVKALLGRIPQSKRVVEK